MKNIYRVLFVIVILLTIIFGTWGYLEANKIRHEGGNISQLTNDTLVLDPIDINENTIKLEVWQLLSEKAPMIRNELQNNNIVSDLLQEKLNKFYSAQADDRYKEAQYLQFINEVQESLELKSTQPKSKGQIETVAKYYDDLKKSTDTLSLGPVFDPFRKKVEQEGDVFRKSLDEVSSGMSYESPPVNLRVADLDKAIDELKKEIIQSLNEWVNLQNEIKDEIANMIHSVWIMPL